MIYISRIYALNKISVAMILPDSFTRLWDGGELLALGNGLKYFTVVLFSSQILDYYVIYR